MSARTLVDKIWDEHVIAELDGGFDLLHVDRHYVHDVTSPQAFTTLADRGHRGVLTRAHVRLTRAQRDDPRRTNRSQQSAEPSSSSR